MLFWQRFHKKYLIVKLRNKITLVNLKYCLCYRLDNIICTIHTFQPHHYSIFTKILQKFTISRILLIGTAKRIETCKNCNLPATTCNPPCIHKFNRSVPPQRSLLTLINHIFILTAYRNLFLYNRPATYTIR